jgi:DNA (cytosine-5)-methyltransferase 1
MAGLNALSLFAGAGGLDLGARMAGLDVVASVEFNPLACQSLSANGFHPVQADVTAVDYSQWTGVDVLFGGPPCQGHSIANSSQRSVADPRNLLAYHLLRGVA